MRRGRSIVAPVPGIAKRWELTSSGRSYLEGPYGSGDTARLIIEPAAAAPTVLLLAFHGTSASETFTQTGNWSPILDDNLGNGHSIVSANAFGSSWGSEAALDEYQDAYEWAVDIYPTVEHVILVGQSMGGLASLAGYAQGRYPLAVGWYGIAPVCSLHNQYDDNPTHAALIEAGHPGWATPGVWDDVITAGHDPYDDFADTVWDGFHMRFVASEADTGVVKANNSDVLAAKASSTAAEASVHTVTGAHLSAEHFDAADLATFIGRAVA